MNYSIFLIGARGCGKTTVGEALAKALSYHFVDTDRYLLNRSGMSVAEIVSREGWEGFRARETQALHTVTAKSSVIATGGGMILAPENRGFMREKGVVIYLCAPATVLAARLEAFPQADQRPTLTGKSIAVEIGEVLSEREALYRQCAHHIVDATLVPEQIVKAALAVL